MKTINIVQAFVLRLHKIEGEGELKTVTEVVHKFEAGLHTVEEDIADHWFVKGHTGDVPALSALEAQKADLAAKQAELAQGQSALAQSMKALQEAQAELEAQKADLAAKQAAATPPAPPAPPAPAPAPAAKATAKA